MNLNQVTLPCTDVERGVAFYRQLGLTLIVLNLPGYARFECPSGGSTLSLHLTEAPHDPGVVIYFECPNLDATVDRLKAAGVQIEAEAQDQPWLWREAYLRDPDGNQICLFRPQQYRRFPPWRLADAVPAPETALRWSEFTHAEPELAAIGERLLFQFGPGLAFLGSVRGDGGPRMHPVCPVLAAGGLYLFVVPTSPKAADLRRDPRIALHAFPSPHEDEEFYITGRACQIDDATVRASATAAAKHSIRDTDLLFELRLATALHTTWENWATPQTRPHHVVWRALGGRR